MHGIAFSPSYPVYRYWTYCAMCSFCCTLWEEVYLSYSNVGLNLLPGLRIKCPQKKPFQSCSGNLNLPFCPLLCLVYRCVSFSNACVSSLSHFVQVQFEFCIFLIQIWKKKKKKSSNYGLGWICFQWGLQNHNLILPFYKINFQLMQ